MRIAFVSQPFDESVPPIQSGSIQIWTYQVALCLAQDHEVTICATRKAGAGREQRADGIRYLRFSTFVDVWLLRLLRLAKRLAPADPRRPEHASIFSYLGYLLQVAWHVRRERYDVVHVHNFSQFVSVVRWLNPRVPIVLHMQGEWLTQLDRGMIRRRLRHADLVIGCSDYLMEKLRRAIPEVAARTCTIPNGVDVDHFVAEEHAPKPGEPVEILFVGRHSPEKGVHDLLDALRELVAQGRLLRATIVGPRYVVPSDVIVDMSDDPKVLALQRFYPLGPNDQASYPALLEAQRADGLAGRVDFPGSIPHSELDALYRKAHILTNPSLSETFGIALVEAMAAGIPTVATKVGGMVEIVVHGETGFLVDAADPAGLADALRALIDAPELRQRLGRAGRRRAEDLFTWRRIALLLARHYADLSPR